MRQPHEMIPTQREIPARYRRQPVAYPGKESAGTIVIDTDNKFLYLVQGEGQAIRYGIGVGREGFTWRGVQSVTHEARMAGLAAAGGDAQAPPRSAAHMAGGPDNPLGARALYLGSSLYRIHGTNEPYTIGQSVSSGCIRMLNEDVHGSVRARAGRHQGDRHVSRTVKDGRPRNSVACISTVSSFEARMFRIRAPQDEEVCGWHHHSPHAEVRATHDPEKLQTFG